MIPIFRSLYLFYAELTGSYPAALLLLSVTTTLIIMLLSHLFRKYPAREAQVQALMAPQLTKIAAEPDPGRRHQKTVQLYRRYRYHPILALRSALPLFFQLPFLFAAYYALRALPELSGVSFGIIRDLSQPDALLVGYNVLPFVMTAINLITAGLNPTFKLQERIQAVVIAAIFLMLLYNAPAALLIYWTMNNIFFLLRTLWDRRHTPRATSMNSSLKLYLPALCRELFLPFFVLIIYSNLLQYLADGEGRFFSRFSKTVPLMVASLGFYVMQLQNLTSRKKRWGYLVGALPILLVGLLQVSGRFSIATDNYVIFPILAAFYLFLGCLLRLIHILAAKASSSKARELSVAQQRSDGAELSCRQQVFYYVPSLILLLIPVLHLASVNHAYLFGGYYLLFLLLPFTLYLIARVTLFAFTSKVPDQVLYHSYAIAFSVVFCFLPTIRAAIQKSSAHDADFWLLLFGALFAIWLFRRHQSRLRNPALVPSSQGLINSEQSQDGSSPRSQLPIVKRGSHRSFFVLSNALLIIFLIRFGLSFQNESSGSRADLMPIPPVLQELSIADSTNIYLFVYDSIPNERVFRDLGLPFEPLKKLLDTYGFRLYDDTYTLGDESLNSMAMTLNITDERYSSQTQMQDIYSGNNLANSILRENGYRCHVLLDNYYTGTSAIANQSIVEEYFPPKELSDVHSDFFFTLLRGVLQGEFRFDTKGILAEGRFTEADRQARKHELIREPATRRFVIDHYSQPGHSQNSGQCLPNETELWIQRYLAALKQLEADLVTLQKHDPQAIVILIGDHGPALTGDCYVLQNWALEDITPDLIWDRIGTLVAIHWPDSARAAKYDQNLQLNQDIFAIVLAYLADDPTPLKLLPDRTFTGYELLTRPAIRFKQGKLLN